MFSGAGQMREPNPLVVNMSHHASLLMLNVRGILGHVTITVQAAPASRAMSAESWSLEGLENAVQILDLSMQQLTYESFYFSTSAATKSLLQAHTGRRPGRTTCR